MRTRNRNIRRNQSKQGWSRQWPQRLPNIEGLEARLLMHANAAEDAEHAAVFALVPDSAATYKSVASGNWSDPTVWNHFNSTTNTWVADGTTPGSNANVVISAATTVTVDGDEAIDASGNRLALHTIRDDGVLTFNTHVNTELLVDTFIVSPQGVLDIGTASDPVASNVTAQVVFADGTANDGSNRDIDLNWDPLQFSRGLVSHG